MLTKIKGLHHLTSMGASTQENSDLPRRSAAPRKEDCEFRRGGLSPLLQRGTPGSVMTYFPFPMSPRHVRVPNWERPLSPSPKTRLATGKKDSPLTVWPDFRSSNSGTRSAFASGFPDGDAFSLVAVDGVRAPVRQHRGRPGQGDHGLPPDKSASKGCRCNARANQLHGLPGGGSQRRLVELRHQRRQRRRRHRSGNSPQGRSRRLGAGSVHHIAFAVDDRAAQLEVRKA